ncbi:hypothetical protein [Actinopolymorpha rutila]
MRHYEEAGLVVPSARSQGRFASTPSRTCSG